MNVKSQNGSPVLITLLFARLRLSLNQVLTVPMSFGL